MQIENDLYERIRQAMPIACVDLLVMNGADEILLIRRTNEPAIGQWWFPGGRVQFGERREAAARRKLLEECGLDVPQLQELKTFDVILPYATNERSSHGITTIFAARIAEPRLVRLDPQSSAFCWKTVHVWQTEQLHPFIVECLRSLAPMADPAAAR
jgi:ADP-ribose pyrophosphatase YjhB (NUDIX family)